MSTIIIKAGTTDIQGSTVKGSFSYYSGDTTHDLGASSLTGFYSGVNAPDNGYAIYQIGGLQGVTVRIANNTSELNVILIQAGATGLTVDQNITWATNTGSMYINSGTTLATPTPTQTGTPTQTPTPTVTPTHTMTPTQTTTPTPTPSTSPLPVYDISIFGRSLAIAANSSIYNTTFWVYMDIIDPSSNYTQYVAYIYATDPYGEWPQCGIYSSYPMVEGSQVSIYVLSWPGVACGFNANFGESYVANCPSTATGYCYNGTSFTFTVTQSQSVSIMVNNPSGVPATCN
jgi:hypothetical protein